MTVAGARTQPPPAAVTGGARPAACRRRGRWIYAAAVSVAAVAFVIALGPGAGLTAGLGGLAVYAAARFACSPPPAGPRRRAYREVR